MAPIGMSRPDIVRTAKNIAEEYRRQNLRLTLRQMYYVFVARGLVGSGTNIYKSIGNALSEARMRGEFPMEAIEDRGRDAKAGEFSMCEDSLFRATGNIHHTLGRLPEIYLQYDRWFGQRKFVSVWVEKEALSGVFAPTCDDLGVGLFACKGYPSVSSIYQWLTHLQAATRRPDQSAPDRDRGGFHIGGMCTEALILYFGDHDPDGWEIPRSCLRTIRTLMRAKDQRTGRPLVDLRPGVRVNMHRVALNMDQIQQYNPPPFEAKVTSSRYQGYKTEHGTDDAWELDALEPTVLQRLIREQVIQHFDQTIFDHHWGVIEKKREDMRGRMLREGFCDNAILDTKSRAPKPKPMNPGKSIKATGEAPEGDTPSIFDGEE